MVLIEAAVPASFLVLTPSPGEANVPIDAAVAASSLALAPALGAGVVLIEAAVPASFLVFTPSPGEANVPIDAAVAASSLALAPALGAGIVLIGGGCPRLVLGAHARARGGRAVEHDHLGRRGVGDLVVVDQGVGAGRDRGTEGQGGQGRYELVRRGNGR